MKSGFDYVIVGGGSAGCVLAARLSEEAECEVLLVEAGPSDSRFDSWKIEIPAALRRNLIDDKYNWHFHSVAQPNLNGRKIYCPRGRVLGGSSSLNAMAYVRGHARDYERWGEAVGDGWDYAGVLPYFKKCETYSEGGCDYRGDAGPLFVTAGMTGKTTGQVNPLFATFVEAGGEAGYPLTADSNGFQQEGFGRMDMTIHRGRRQSASAAYLRPLGGRRNLTILTGARATKIALKNGRALGNRDCRARFCVGGARGCDLRGGGFVAASFAVVGDRRRRRFAGAWDRAENPAARSRAQSARSLGSVCPARMRKARHIAAVDDLFRDGGGRRALAFAARRRLRVFAHGGGGVCEIRFRAFAAGHSVSFFAHGVERSRAGFVSRACVSSACRHDAPAKPRRFALARFPIRFRRR